MRNDTAVAQPFELLARAADSFQPLFLLATRWYVSWQFLKSGWLKATSWQSTLDLFPGKYHAPLLSHHAATAAGAFGELFSPVLLVLGLGGRLGPIGLFAVNLVAVISYSQVLLAEGFEAALAQHVLWGFILLMLLIFGYGPLALDRLVGKRLGSTKS